MIITGLIVGAIIRYAGTTSPVIHLSVEPAEGDAQFNQSLPPDTLWLKVIFIVFTYYDNIICEKICLSIIYSFPANFNHLIIRYQIKHTRTHFVVK